MISPSVLVVSALERALLDSPGLEFTISSNPNGEFFVVANRRGVIVGGAKEYSLVAAIQELFRSGSWETFFQTGSSTGGEKL